MARQQMAQRPLGPAREKMMRAGLGPEAPTALTGREVLSLVMLVLGAALMVTAAFLVSVVAGMAVAGGILYVTAVLLGMFR